MITVGTLVIGGLAPVVASRICDDMVAACARFDISTPARQGAFVAQCSVESTDFSRREENLFYTTAARVLGVFPSKVKTAEQAAALLRNPVELANFVYAGGNGNDPDPAVGDGHRYRGRGWIQLSGKTNYRLAGDDCGLPFLDDPDSVARVPGCCQSAAAFWDRTGCSALADAGRWDDVTRRVNGPGMLMRGLRAARSISFASAFSGWE